MFREHGTRFTVKKKPTQEAEYRLLIEPFLNERDQKIKVAFRLETTKHFTSFQYEIAVEDSLEDHTIHYRLHGLKTPPLSLPSTGPAQFRKDYDALKGVYEIIIESLDGTRNTFSVRINTSGATLLKQPRQRFVEVIVGKTIAGQ